MQPAIALITLDLDDTLWPCEPVIAAAEAECHAWLVRECPALAASHDIASLRAHRRALMYSRPEIAHDITRVRIESLRTLLAQFGCAAALAEAAVEVFLSARHRVSPYPDVAPVLRALRRHYRLVSVTNGNADVERTALSGYFDFSLTAAGVGAAKPAPEMFLRALRQAGLKSTQAVHVGDDPQLDMETARRVGMRAVWMNRGGLAWPEALQGPAAVVRDLHELRRWLQSEPARLAQ